MKITWGTTRIVLLTKNWAIKIPRIRPVRPVVRLVQLLMCGQVKRQLRTYHPNAIGGVLKYLTAGLRANRIDVLASRLGCRDVVYAEQYLGGLIVLQLRGDEVSVEEAKSHPLWSPIRHAEQCDKRATEQFARFGERILLVDVNAICPILFRIL